MCSYFFILVLVLYFCSPCLFLMLFFLFRHKGDITVSFFLTAGIAIVLHIIIKVFLKNKLSTLKSAK